MKDRDRFVLTEDLPEQPKPRSTGCDIEWYGHPQRMHIDYMISYISTGRIPTKDEVDALSDIVAAHLKTMGVTWS
jgi:hypothetical protein